MKRWWDNGLIPENSASWDDSGNNTAYNSGQAAFVFNPASIFAYLEANDPDLLAETTQAPFPAGSGGELPVGRHLVLVDLRRAARTSMPPSR